MIYKKKKKIKKKKILYIMHLKKKCYLNFFKFLNLYYKNSNNKIAKNLFKLCHKRQGLFGLANKKIKLFKKSKDIMNNIIKDIKKATKTIKIIFYIWKPGGIADKVANTLINSSNKGVKCKLILDSNGSSEFFRSSWVNRMKSSGIQIVEALKINLYSFFLRRIDLRQHRKIIIIDNNIVYTGSMNLVDPKLFKQSYGLGKWIDLMIRLEGSIAKIIGIIFACDWELETGKKKKNKSKKFIKFNKKSILIEVIPSGPGFVKNIIHQVLLTAIYSAKKKIIITTPYFVPSKHLLCAICIAAQRGVKVIIILPKYNDSFLVNWASKYFFTELLKSGVKIYQFQKGLLHSKSILIDNKLSLIGTCNFDMRSLWLNFEITLIINNNKFGKKLSKIQYEYILHSKLVHLKNWSLRSYWKRIIENFIYLFNSLL